MPCFGLLGKSLSHSFSKKYFTKKFEELGLKEHHYELFEIQSIQDFPKLIAEKSPLAGLNVTLPYKEEVIQYLTRLDTSAANVGAVNVIKCMPNGELVGYNSDYFGFKLSLEQFSKRVNMPLVDIQALVLGTGGAAKGVYAALRELNIKYKTVSRDKQKADFAYNDLTAEVLQDYKLIINSSPVGMYPAIDACPDIPYQALDGSFMLYDLVYNPENTLFMQKGALQGANVANGLDMLYLQAEKAWEIWNE